MIKRWNTMKIAGWGAVLGVVYSAVKTVMEGQFALARTNPGLTLAAKQHRIGGRQFHNGGLRRLAVLRQLLLDVGALIRGEARRKHR